MRIYTDRLAVVSIAVTESPMATCPDCGDKMVKSTATPITFVCGKCGAVQRIEVLSTAAATRQIAHLDVRGTDRLLAAFIGEQADNQLPNVA